MRKTDLAIHPRRALVTRDPRPVHVDTKRLPLPTPDRDGGEAPAARRQVWQQRRSHNGLTPQAQQQN